LLHKYCVISLLIFIIIGCQSSQKQDKIEHHKILIQPKYAQGFKLIKAQDQTVLIIKNPYQNADKTYRYLIINDTTEAFNSDNFDGIIKTPLASIVVTSTTHIPALELLEKEHLLVGFPNINYISSEKTRQLINDGEIIDLGSNEGLNTEVLLNLNPDVIVGFGIDSHNKAFNNLTNIGIPVVYNGDWMETSPLGKAEWIKFFGVLLDKQQAADSIFNQIEKDYLAAKKIAQQTNNKPTILSGALYRDVWYLPGGDSTEAQLLKDANVNYLWQDTKTSGSLSLSFETVFEKGKDADIWLNPSNYKSYSVLEKSNKNYTEFKAYKSKNIFSVANTTGAKGGTIYYELGTTRPDWVLKDLIKICHPHLLPDYQPIFFKPLK
jgi:iron complex transport system substrate-binding protein